MHGVRQEVLQAQAAAAGLPLWRVPIPASCPDAVYEAAMHQAVEQAVRQGVTRMIFGDLFLEEIRAYREKMLAGTGLAPVFPLWGSPTRRLAEQMIDAGLVALISCVDLSKAPRELAGRRFDRQLLGLLPAWVDPCAERGEFHTCVCAGPMFSRPIPLAVGEKVERDGFLFADLKLV